MKREIEMLTWEMSSGKLMLCKDALPKNKFLTLSGPFMDEVDQQETRVDRKFLNYS